MTFVQVYTVQEVYHEREGKRRLPMTARPMVTNVYLALGLVIVG